MTLKLYFMKCPERKISQRILPLIAIYFIFCRFLLIFKTNNFFRNFGRWLLLNSFKFLLVEQYKKIPLYFFSEEKAQPVHSR